VIQAEAEHNINALRLALESKDKDIAELQIEVKTLDRVIDKSRIQERSATVDELKNT
jgi:hypothetical protein